MTNFGKTLSIVIVIIIIIGLIIWFVSRRPAAEMNTGTEPNTQQQGTASETSTSDQSLEQDMGSIDAQMQGLDTDAAAAADVNS